MRCVRYLEPRLHIEVMHMGVVQLKSGRFMHNTAGEVLIERT